MNEKHTIPVPENLDPYDGRWVAMRRGKVVAHAEDEGTLRGHPALEQGDLVFPVGHPATAFYLLNV